MADSADWASAGVDVHTPSTARIYDYYLGGKDNFPADRTAAERVLAAAPDSRRLARSNRGFVLRAARLMAEAGVRQFIDLGTGIPTSPSVHEMVREVAPDARVVYVDNDPIVLAHNRALLAVDDRVTTIRQDLRDPAGVLANPDLTALIDFDEPVGVIFAAVFHFVTEAEDPAGIVAAFGESMVPGSHLVISQVTSDGTDPETIEQTRAAYANATAPVTFRPAAQIERFFDGFELLDPGLVPVEAWRPDTEVPGTRLKIIGAVGRR